MKELLEACCLLSTFIATKMEGEVFFITAIICFTQLRIMDGNYQTRVKNLILKSKIFQLAWKESITLFGLLQILV